VVPLYGGAKCPQLEENGTCDSVDCAVDEWTDWTDCDAFGKKIRTRVITVVPKYKGKECPAIVEEQDCPLQKTQQSDPAAIGRMFEAADRSRTRILGGRAGGMRWSFS
jgi:hypothetical protein